MMKIKSAIFVRIIVYKPKGPFNPEKVHFYANKRY